MCAQNDKFYLQVKHRTPLDDGSPWFAASRLHGVRAGGNSLGGMRKQICGDTKIPLKMKGYRDN